MHAEQLLYSIGVQSLVLTTRAVFPLECGKTDRQTDATERPTHAGGYACVGNEETHLDVFEMKGLRNILRVSWTAKKTNEWVLNKAGVKRELLDTVKARKLAYHGHTIRKEKEIMQRTMLPGARRRGRARTAWMDNISTWTGRPMEESIRMTEDRDKDKWRKYVHGVANPRIEDN